MVNKKKSSPPTLGKGGLTNKQISTDSDSHPRPAQKPEAIVPRREEILLQVLRCPIQTKFRPVISRTQRTGNAFERLVLFTGFTQFEFVLRKPPFCDVAEYGEADQA